jgi:preprotein translocase subunit SecG
MPRAILIIALVIVIALVVLRLMRRKGGDGK